MQFALFGRTIIILASMLFAGCASNAGTGPTAGQSVEQFVTSRAQARWDALRAAQFDKAYGFLTPSTRLTLPLDAFRGRLGGASWLGAQVVKVTCEPEVCDVSVKLEYYVLPNVKDAQVINEKWISDSGNWWVVYQG